MPARDFHHNAVKAALIHDGWTITDEDYLIVVDIVAEGIVEWRK